MAKRVCALREQGCRQSCLPVGSVKSIHTTMGMLRAALGDGAGSTALLAGWPASQAVMPDGEVFFLDPSFVAAAARQAELDPDLECAMLSAARRIAGNPLARALVW